MVPEASILEYLFWIHPDVQRLRHRALSLEPEKASYPAKPSNADQWLVKAGTGQQSQPEQMVKCRAHLPWLGHSLEQRATFPI